MEPMDEPVQQALPFDEDPENAPEVDAPDEGELASFLEQVAADEGIDEDDREDD
jgi:hypothetical protein